MLNKTKIHNPLAYPDYPEYDEYMDAMKEEFELEMAYERQIRACATPLAEPVEEEPF